MEKVIVVDDDPMVGDLTLSILEEAGYQAELISDSRIALDAVKKAHPDLVILDVLMPGIDGLTLCHSIKKDPDLASIKVAIVSGKSFEAEKERAARCGADLFIEKPYQVETFAQQIRDLMGTPQTAAIAAPAKAVVSQEKQAKLHLKIWGCRSPSVNSAPPSRYGRNTPCVSVDFDGHLFIFDAGSGLDALASELMSEKSRATLWLFLTQFHDDHFSALGRFACARSKGVTLYISGANDLDKTLQSQVEEAFASAQDTRPVTAEIQLYELIEETYEILPGVRLTSFYANHPGTTLGYKLETSGRTIVYCPDSELYGEAATAFQDYDEKLGKICAGADLLIHDARFSDADYASRKNKGHSSANNAVEFAARFEVKELVLFHQDGSYEDADLDRTAEETSALIAEKGYTLKCSLARDGLDVSV